jgi:UbiD family decarboxylase
MNPQSSRKEIVRELNRRAAKPIAPVVVGTSYAGENVLEGRKIDFLKLPVPQWNATESHRYIGTWHINVTKDPESGVRNVGTYRMQVLGPRHATLSTSLRSHLALHLAKAEKAGRPLEMAVAIGVGEVLVMAGAAGCPEGQDEYELAGGFQNRPVEIVKCSTVDLDVPADSEIVIEGVIHPGKRFPDGPYFDYAGVPNLNPNAFIFEAKRLSFRDNPIFRGAAIGCPGAEDQQLFSILAELNLFDFHGSRARRFVQKHLIANRLFRSFQFAGKI